MQSIRQAEIEDMEADWNGRCAYLDRTGIVTGTCVFGYMDRKPEGGVLVGIYTRISSVCKGP